MGQLQKILYISNDSMLSQIFLKLKIFFKKLEENFLVKSAKTENIIFWYKTALSEVSVKTNGMANAKWIYHKEWIFAQ